MNMNYKEFKSYVENNLEFVERLQEYCKLLPDKELEAFEAYTQSLWSCLDMVSDMLERQELIYKPKRRNDRILTKLNTPEGNFFPKGH